MRRIGLLVDPTHNPFAVLAEVRRQPALRMLVSILDSRIRNGSTLIVWRMLCSIRLSPAAAHAIIEAWPKCEQRGTPEALMTFEEELACYLACFVRGFETYDWVLLMNNALRVAQSDPAPKNGM